MSLFVRLARPVFVALLAAAAVTGCAGSGASGGGATTSAPRAKVDPLLITQDELQSRNFNNLYEAVAILRSSWLRPRNPDSFDSPSTIQVYLDNLRIGGVDQLKGLQVITVGSVRWYDGIQATARWGMDNAAGAIAVTSRR